MNLLKTPIASYDLSGLRPHLVKPVKYWLKQNDYLEVGQQMDEEMGCGSDCGKQINSYFNDCYSTLYGKFASRFGMGVNELAERIHELHGDEAVKLLGMGHLLMGRRLSRVVYNDHRLFQF